MNIQWPTHKYRIMLAGHKVHEGDEILVALEHFGSMCGAARQARDLVYLAGNHDVTGEPLVEARYYNEHGRLFAVLYGVTLEQWNEHGVSHEQAQG